jgi:hypothetical protein
VILFCGIPSEAPLALAIEEARRRDVPHVVLNQRETHAMRWTLDVTRGAMSGRVWVQGRELPLAHVNGVYTRLIDSAQLPEHQPRSARVLDPDGVQRAAAMQDALGQWMQVTPARVANRPQAGLSNASKPFQLQRIRDAGLLVPPTLVTNCVDALAAFRAAHGRVIYKSISGVRSIVHELTPRALARLPLLRALPTQFQALVPGTDVRVHVVGARVFATRIVTSGGTDYRYAARDGHDVTLTPDVLPGEVADACTRLSAALDLPFCGIDLRHGTDGRYYCFEANPSPAYSYYEQAAGQPIAAALVDWLQGAAC